MFDGVWNTDVYFPTATNNERHVQINFVKDFFKISTIIVYGRNYYDQPSSYDCKTDESTFSGSGCGPQIDGSWAIVTVNNVKKKTCGQITFVDGLSRYDQAYVFSCEDFIGNGVRFAVPANKGPLIHEIRIYRRGISYFYTNFVWYYCNWHWCNLVKVAFVRFVKI